MPAKTLSVVIPLYNEENSIRELWQRLAAVIDSIGIEAEVIFIDDGSRDRTGAEIHEICGHDPRVKLITLSRNFGHAAALSAGIDHAQNQLVVLMDGDLQDKPESIPAFIAEWEKGFEVVYAIRTTRKENLILRGAFKSFYRLLNRMSGIKQPLDAGIFCLIDRKVVDVIKSMSERNRYFPGLRAYAGFNQTGVPVERDARYAGKSRVRPIGLIKLALDGLIAFSYIPLRMVTAAGVIVSFSAFAYMIRVLYKKLVSHEAIIGWASTLTAILFLGGMQLLTLGIVGEYIGRIYEEVKKRPYYIIKSITCRSGDR